MKDYQDTLLELAAECYDDPVRFVEIAFDWGSGELLGFDGPDKWQRDFLEELGRDIADAEANDKPVRHATASGHGIGKSACVAWIILWYMTTRPRARVRVTANTEKQLLGTTWPELALWHKRSIFKEWFLWEATRFSKIGDRENWFAEALSWSENNPDSFAGLHGRFVMLIMDEACHDDQTDVLTENGWKRFAELRLGERLLTMNPQTGEAFYEAPTELVAMPYRGQMYKLDRRGASYCVTPRHKMLYQTLHQKRKSGTWTLKPIEEMSTRSPNAVPKTIISRDAARIESFTLPSHTSDRKFYPEVSLPMDKWLNFLGWYFSEGCTTHTKGRPSSVVITQFNELHRGEVRDCVQFIADYCTETKKVGFFEKTGSYRTHAPAVAAWLSQFGGKAIQKIIPPFIRHLPPEQIRIFLDAFIKGDGYWRGDRAIIYTSSPQMADDLHELCLLCGGVATLTTRKGEGEKWILDHIANSSRDAYVVYWTPDVNRSFVIGGDKSIGDLVDYDGFVYCAHMPSHHVMFTRRNGRCMWSGNSGVADSIWETAMGVITSAGNAHLAFGNPIRPSGGFYDCFHHPKKSKRWKTRHINALETKIGNSQSNREIFEDYGPEHDVTRRRVLGQFPRQAASQFISTADVEGAMNRQLEYDDYANFPVYMGVDVARFGDDRSCILLRQGPKVLDIQTFEGADTVQVANIATGLLKSRKDIQMVFVDEVGVGAGVVDMMRRYDDRVSGVNVGRRPTNMKLYKNLRVELWDKMRQDIPKMDLPSNESLKRELTTIEYDFTDQGQMRLERKIDIKRRGLESPDIADALALTYARPDGAEFELFDSDDEMWESRPKSGRSAVTGY